jgi:DNA-binding NtrC family response regulator
MRQLLKAVDTAASGPRAVLIMGEVGSGREAVARAIHDAAGVARGRFVSINCAALAGHLVESELFGQASTSEADRRGLLHSADGGTLFIDALAEMTPEVQARLLHVLEEGAVRPRGSSVETKVDVRVVASASSDLFQAIESGAFRSDLLHHFQRSTILTPPLRERREDIPLLVEHFLDTFCNRRCGCIWGVSQATLDVLVAYDWPGNVRELRAAIEHAVSSGESALIRVQDLPSHFHPLAHADANVGHLDADCFPTLVQAEARLIRATLDHFLGNKVRAARSLGISRHKLYERLRRLGLH